MEIGSINTPIEFSIDAKSFLESCCKNVIKKNEELLIKDNFRSLGHRVFYSNMVDLLGVKLFIYKMKEFKLRSSSEDKYYRSSLIINNQQRQLWQNTKNDTTNFLKSVTSNVLSDYLNYAKNVKSNAVTIQKIYKGHLLRLIHKMNMMNYKLEIENKNAEARARKKSELLKEKRKTMK